jgi:hypothetical protein
MLKVFFMQEILSCNPKKINPAPGVITLNLNIFSYMHKLTVVCEKVL